MKSLEEMRNRYSEINTTLEIEKNAIDLLNRL